MRRATAQPRRGQGTNHSTTYWKNANHINQEPPRQLSSTNLSFLAEAESPQNEAGHLKIRGFEGCLSQSRSHTSKTSFTDVDGILLQAGPGTGQFNDPPCSHISTEMCFIARFVRSRAVNATLQHRGKSDLPEEEIKKEKGQKKRGKGRGECEAKEEI